MERLNIAIVGHVDHGKSTLIGRLLCDTKSLPQEKIDEVISTCNGLGKKFEFAYILDAFLEEREKEMTIDTTQIHFKTASREYIIIDTPGHKELLKNMVTGASYAEAAVLIVSAKDGIQEQTKRHTYILKLLGIKQIVVVVNKMDAVSYSQLAFESLKEKIERFFGQFNMQILNIIPISAKEGDNIASRSKNMLWYTDEILPSALDNCKKETFQYDFRMPVQDIYHFKDKDIVVGRICSGEISRNDRIVVLPAKREVKVDSILAFEGKKDKASATESIGLILEEQNVIKRGDILFHQVNQAPPKIEDKFLSLVLCLKGNLESEVPYILQCATQQAGCKIEKIEEQIDIYTLANTSVNFLSEAEIGRVWVATDRPLVYEEFNRLNELGRFVLRKDNDIVGAGIII